MFEAGCSNTRMTDTARTGVEQLLLSHSVDRCLQKLDFGPLAGHSVYVDERFLDSVDRKYVAAALRRELFTAGVRVVEKAEEAEFVLEVSSGALGTDRSEGFLGIPAIRVPGPYSFETPEVRFISQTTQYGTAKLSFVLYDTKSREALGGGTLLLARSSNTNWFILGIGPFNSGTIREDLLAARKEMLRSQETKVALVDPHRLQRLAMKEASVLAAPKNEEANFSEVPVPTATPWTPPPDTTMLPPASSEDGSRHPVLLWPPDPNLPPLGLPLPPVLP